MEEEAEASRPWRCSTNWEETEECSLERSISFETSEEDAPALTSAGSVLTRPASDDPPPCEVTVLLNRKYEIHRIYAKSTARTFEVYYSKGNTQSDTKEYLCTVKCGPALSGSNSSVHSSEEETWVEVKSHESSSSSDISKENQMHYEATAEISDADPCVSLTLRFLSLQTKSSIHIEEIYILADPLDESSTPQNPNTGTAGNFNASSMFAMLVPNLLQMSKSGLSNRINDQYFSTERTRNVEKIEDQTAKFQNPVTEESSTQDLNPIDRTRIGNTEKTEDQTVKFQNRVTEKIDIQEPQNPIEKNDYVEKVNEQTHINTETRDINIKQAVPTSQVEKLLETLVSKVENIENYFTKFEEKMVGPITTIQTRLFNLESRFDQFSTDLQSLRDNSVADGVAGHSRPGSNIESMLVRLESRFDQFSTDLQSMKVKTKRDNSVADRVAGHSRPGFRAPEFISDDDSTDDDDILNDNNNTVSNNNNNNNNNNNSNNNNNVSKRRPISIDGALASALAAFASGSKSDPNPTAESDSGDKMNDLDSVYQTGRVGEIPVKSLSGEDGVPLVFIDEVRVETVSVSDPFLSFEEISEGLDRNVEKMSGFEKEINELDQNVEKMSGSEKETDELGQNSDRIGEFEKEMNNLDQSLEQMTEFDKKMDELDRNFDQNFDPNRMTEFDKKMDELDRNFDPDRMTEYDKRMNELDRNFDQSWDQMAGFEDNMNELDQNPDQIDGFEKEINESDQNSGRIDGDLMNDKIKNNQGFFCKSVIGEISDEEEEELGFGSDLHRFACNSPLSETASEFESNFPTFNIITTNNDDNNSTDSSFDENFLKSRVQLQIDLSDSESTESGILHKSTLKSSEIDSSFDQDLLGGISGNVLSSNGPLIDLDLEEKSGNISEACQKNGNMEQFDSLI